jgi:hypothetical protein
LKDASTGPDNRMISQRDASEAMMQPQRGQPLVVGTRRTHRKFLPAAAVARALLIVIALVACPTAFGQTRVYLLRGWFGVFSTGMDTIAEELRAKGIKADAIGHLEWKSTAAKIAADRAAGATGPLVLIGHSQGGNNVIDMARELEKQSIPVDLLVTVAPFMQEPVPSNVVRAINYYQSPGWGSPLVASRDSRDSFPTSMSPKTPPSSISIWTRTPRSRRRSSARSRGLANNVSQQVTR